MPGPFSSSKRSLAWLVELASFTVEVVAARVEPLVVKGESTIPPIMVTV
jgi:hypothetical protein